MAMKFRTDLPESGGANYLKLKDKQSVTGIFRGEPHDFCVLWTNGKSSECTPDTPGARFRFRINFVVKEGATYVPKIFENSKTVYETLALLNTDYDLEKTVVKITRQGSDMSNTTYHILPMPTPVDPMTLNLLETLKLNDLTGKRDHNSPPREEAPWPGQNDNPEIPF